MVNALPSTQHVAILAAAAAATATTNWDRGSSRGAVT
jgi:hypothetical protein